MFAYLAIIRPVNCVMAAFSVYVASLIAGMGFYPTLPVIYALVSVFLICGGGMAVNDYFDVEIDRVNKPQRPIPSGKISKRKAAAYSAALFAIGVGISYLINTPAFAVATAAAILLVLYAWRLKRIILTGNLAVSGLVALTFIYGGLINLNYLPTLSLAALAFLSNTGREIYKTVEDELGDKKAGVQSIAIKYGVIRARVIASIFILFAIMLSFLPYLLGIFSGVYLFFVAIADIVFLAAVLSPVKFSAKLCKAAMFVALLAFFVGSVA